VSNVTAAGDGHEPPGAREAELQRQVDELQGQVDELSAALDARRRPELEWLADGYHRGYQAALERLDQ
jgi:hypothetical protein